MRKIKLFFLFLLMLLDSCSPMKSSANEEKHQLELTLHELQTNLDDLRHDLNCFQTEMQIVDGRIKNQEDFSQNIKQQHIEKLQNKTEYLQKQLSQLDNKLSSIDKNLVCLKDDLKSLVNHANDTTLALTQYKEKINDLETESIVQNKKTEEILNIKSNIKELVQSIKATSENYILYTVKIGDSLEKIAKKNQTSVENIKKFNSLENDLIIIGQELKLPKY